MPANPNLIYNPFHKQIEVMVARQKIFSDVSKLKRYTEGNTLFINCSNNFDDALCLMKSLRVQEAMFCHKFVVGDELCKIINTGITLIKDKHNECPLNCKIPKLLEDKYIDLDIDFYVIFFGIEIKNIRMYYEKRDYNMINVLDEPLSNCFKEKICD